MLAEQASGGPGGALGAFATGPAWADNTGTWPPPNWIDATEPTDGDLISIGCAAVYLYWMASQGYTFAQITQAGCSDGSLASNYMALTGKSTAWADFSAAVGALPGGVTGDDPWAGAAPVPVPQPPPAPPPVPVPPAPSRQVLTIDVEAKIVQIPTDWGAVFA